jgi:hypothetical protein
MKPLINHAALEEREHWKIIETKSQFVKGSLLMGLITLGAMRSKKNYV